MRLYINIACLLVALTLVLQVAVAKGIEKEDKQNINSIETVEIKESEKLRLSTLKHIFDVEGHEYYEAAFTGSDSGVIICNIPKNLESSLEEKAIYEAETSYIHIKEDYESKSTDSHSVMDTELKSIESIKFVLSDYIDYNKSDLKITGTIESRIKALREQYIENNLNEAREKVAAKMNLLFSVWIVIAAVMFLTRNVHIKIEKS